MSKMSKMTKKVSKTVLSKDKRKKVTKDANVNKENIPTQHNNTRRVRHPRGAKDVSVAKELNAALNSDTSPSSDSEHAAHHSDEDSDASRKGSPPPTVRKKKKGLSVRPPKRDSQKNTAESFQHPVPSSPSSPSTPSSEEDNCPSSHLPSSVRLTHVKSHVREALSDSESDDDAVSATHEDSESASSQERGTTKNIRKSKSAVRCGKPKTSKTSKPKRVKPQKQTLRVSDPDNTSPFEYTLQPRGTSGLAKRRHRAISLAVDALDATELAALDSACSYYNTVDKTVLKMA